MKWIRIDINDDFDLAVVQEGFVVGDKDYVCLVVWVLKFEDFMSLVFIFGKSFGVLDTAEFGGSAIGDGDGGKDMLF